jgi:UDP-N-acetylglucosamine 2-epimerase
MEANLELINCKATMLAATRPEAKKVQSILKDLKNHDNIHQIFVQTDHHNDCDLLSILVKKMCRCETTSSTYEVLLN